MYVHRRCAVLVSKTSIHCNRVGCSLSVFLHSFYHSIRDGPYSATVLFVIFSKGHLASLSLVLSFSIDCFLIQWSVFLIKIMHEKASIWSLVDRHWSTTSLFNTIQGRHKTLFFFFPLMPLFLPTVYWLNILSPFSALSSFSLCGVILYLSYFSLCWSDFFSVTLPFSIPRASKMVITM